MMAEKLDSECPYTMDEELATQDEKVLAWSQYRTLNTIVVVAILLPSIGEALTHSARRDWNNQTEAFKLCKTPIAPPVHQASLDEIATTIKFLVVGTLVSQATSLIAMFANAYSHCQRFELGARMNGRYDFLIKGLAAMLLISLALLVCGLYRHPFSIDPFIGFFLAPIAVPRVMIFPGLSITVTLLTRVVARF